MLSKEYLSSFFILTAVFVFLSLNNEIFAQNEFTNDTSSTNNSFGNTMPNYDQGSNVEYYDYNTNSSAFDTMPNYDQGSNVEYYDYNTNSSAFDESMNRMDDFFSGNMDNYQQPFSGENDILAKFGQSLSNSIFNDTSIFGVLGYSLIDNVKVIGAQTIENSSIKVTLEYNNENTSSVSPAVTIVAYKLDINLSDMGSFLSSAMADSSDMMMMMPSSQSLPFDNNMPVFDIVSNFKIGSNIAESGWSSPHDVIMKVRNGGSNQQNESDVSIILIELIPQG
jgi:hypothetical protein